MDEGSAYSLTLGAVTDPGTDTVNTWVVHWGDGNTDSYGTNGVKTHTYADGPNTYNITVDLTDEDGTYLDRANALSVTVDNVPPTATFSASSPIDEGSSSTLSFTAASDPSAADTIAGFHYSFACDGLTLRSRAPTRPQAPRPRRPVPSPTTVPTRSRAGSSTGMTAPPPTRRPWS